mgnify:CR=1 FL=1
MTIANKDEFDVCVPDTPVAMARATDVLPHGRVRSAANFFFFFFFSFLFFGQVEGMAAGKGAALRARLAGGDKVYGTACISASPHFLPAFTKVWVSQSVVGVVGVITMIMMMIMMMMVVVITMIMMVISSSTS